MNADDHELVGVFRFEPLEIRQHVHAVDAPVGPEIEQHHLAAQRLQRQRRVHVPAVHRAGQLRRALDLFFDPTTHPPIVLAPGGVATIVSIAAAREWLSVG